MVGLVQVEKVVDFVLVVLDFAIQLVRVAFLVLIIEEISQLLPELAVPL